MSQPDTFEWAMIMEAQAIMVKVEAMKIENAVAMGQGITVPYRGDAFRDYAITLDQIAGGLRERSRYG